MWCQDQVVIHQKCFCLTVYASLNHNQRLAQRSHMHTLYECQSTPSRTLLGRRHHGKFLWVNAIAVRHNSSQVRHNTSSQSNGKAAKVLINLQLLFMFLFWTSPCSDLCRSVSTRFTINKSTDVTRSHHRIQPLQLQWSKFLSFPSPPQSSHHQPLNR